MNHKNFMQRKRNLLVLHATVFIWGFTGILGALISVSATHLVWYRLVIAIISLWLWLRYNKTVFRIDKISLFKLLATGAVIALHWILFFFSIKQSTVSVTLVCLSSITLFTAILEPIVNKSRISKLEIGIGMMIITGIYLIFEFESQYTVGIVAGLISALCASMFSIINSRLIKKHEAPVISFYELLGGLGWISLYLLFTNGFNADMRLNTHDVFYLFILGTVCTSVAYVAGVSVMKELSAFRVALVTNLEPIYGIILAFTFFGNKEKMSTEFYIGTTIILSSIFLYPIIKNRTMKRKG